MWRVLQETSLINIRKNNHHKRIAMNVPQELLFPWCAYSRNHIHRFQSEVPYLISSLLSQGFPEKIEKPRVQFIRSLRPRPNDELFLR